MGRDDRAEVLCPPSGNFPDPLRGSGEGSGCERRRDEVLLLCSVQGETVTQGGLRVLLVYHLIPLLRDIMGLVALFLRTPTPSPESYKHFEVVPLDSQRRKGVQKVC